LKDKVKLSWYKKLLNDLKDIMLKNKDEYEKKISVILKFGKAVGKR